MYNIFKLLDFDEHESQNLLIRAQLLRVMIDFIENNRLSIDQASAILKVNKTTVHDLLLGNINEFSIDVLANIASNANVSIDIIYKNDVKIH